MNLINEMREVVNNLLPDLIPSLESDLDIALVREALEIAFLEGAKQALKENDGKVN